MFLRDNFKSFFVLVTLMSISFMGTPWKVQAEKRKTQEAIILIDEGHGEIFGYSEIKKAILYADRKTNFNIEAETIKELNSSILSYANLLILPAVNNTGSFSSEEIEAVGTHLRGGGGVLALSLPCKGRVKPNFPAFNRLLDFTGVEFNIEQEKGDIVHNYKLEGDGRSNGTLLSLNESVAKGIAQKKFFEGINEICVRSSSLKLSSNHNFSKVTTQPFSFSVNTNGKIVRRGQFPLLAARKVQKGRFTALGFGKAFTNKTSPLGKPWINLENNTMFFTNILDWLLAMEKEDENVTFPLYYSYLFLGVASILIAGTVVALQKKQKKKPKKKISEAIKEVRKKGEEKE